jgi:hypothetical protein
MSFFNPSKSNTRYQLAAQAEQKQGYADAQGMYAPYREGGNAAWDQLLALGGLGGDRNSALAAVKAQPGYEFGLNQGVDALDRSAASRGKLASGAQMQAIDQYGQDYAQTKLNDYWNRLAGINQTGYNATQSTANARLGLGGQLAQSWQNIGEAKTNQNLALWNLGAQGINSLAKLGGSASGASGGASGFANIAKLFGL